MLPWRSCCFVQLRGNATLDTVHLASTCPYLVLAWVVLQKPWHFSGTQWYCLFVLYWFLIAPNCRHYCKNQISLSLVKGCTLLFCRFPTRQKCSFASASQLKIFPKIHLIVPFVCKYYAVRLHMLSNIHHPAAPSRALLYCLAVFRYFSRKIWTVLSSRP